MRTLSILPLALTGVLTLSLPASAQEQPLDPQRVEARLAKLEAELERQRREIKDLRAQLAKARAAQLVPGRAADSKAADSKASREAEARAALAKSEAALRAAWDRVRDKPGATSRTALAEVLVEEGDLDAAHKQLKEALRVSPGHSRATCRLAELLLARGDVEQAQQSLNGLIELDPTIAEAYSLRGQARIRQSPRPDLSGAIKDLSRAIQLDPALGTAYFQRGVANYESHRFEEAIADLSRAIELGGRGVSALSGRYVQAFAHYYLEDYDEAISGWEWFLEHAPSSYRARARVEKFLAQARAKR